MPLEPLSAPLFYKPEHIYFGSVRAKPSAKFDLHTCKTVFETRLVNDSDRKLNVS